MIVIDDVILSTEENVNHFVDLMRTQAYKKEHEEICDMYLDFLLETLEADIELQKKVIERFGEDYVSFTIIPFQDYDDLRSFSFQLASTEDKEIKRRDELIFQDYCKTCFQYVKPFYIRLAERFSE